MFRSLRRAQPIVTHLKNCRNEKANPGGSKKSLPLLPNPTYSSSCSTSGQVLTPHTFPGAALSRPANLSLSRQYGTTKQDSPPVPHAILTLADIALNRKLAGHAVDSNSNQNSAFLIREAAYALTKIAIAKPEFKNFVRETLVELKETTSTSHIEGRADTYLTELEVLTPETGSTPLTREEKLQKIDRLPQARRMMWANYLTKSSK